MGSQRMELAAYANDLVTFDAGSRVLFQGKVRQKPLWYVISSGTASVNQGNGSESRTITELSRGATFGERSLMRAKTTGQCISEVNVDAGPSGLTCLTFDGDLIYDIFSSLAGSDASLLPSEDVDASEWEQIKSSRSFTKIQCTIRLDALKERCRFWARGPTWERKIALEQVRDLYGEFSPTSGLGQGAFGTVFLVEDSDTDKTYALKRVSKGHASRCGTCQSLCWERDLLNMLDSNFLVRLYRTMKDGTRAVVKRCDLGWGLEQWGSTDDAHGTLRVCSAPLFLVSEDDQGQPPTISEEKNPQGHLGTPATW
eukprot:Skav235048  [mRNA]  locus=scaffold824:75763:81544:- [translate_table: standard]